MGSTNHSRGKKKAIIEEKYGISIDKIQFMDQIARIMQKIEINFLQN